MSSIDRRPTADCPSESASPASTSRHLVPDAVELERICAIGWPGLAEARIGDWLLRFGDGFSGRANSVLVLGDPGMALDDAVSAVCDWYAQHGAPPAFQLPAGTSLPVAIGELEQLLARRGWVSADPTAVLAADIDLVLQRCVVQPDLETTIETSPGADWLATYLYRGRPLPDSAVRVLQSGPDPVFVSLHRAGQVVAVARGVLTQGWLGVTAVTVVESARRAGIGTAAMAAVLRWGRNQSARSVYLQVDRHNAGALALYERLGFDEHHGYSYRRPGPGQR